MVGANTWPCGPSRPIAILTLGCRLGRGAEPSRYPIERQALGPWGEVEGQHLPLGA